MTIVTPALSRFVIIKQVRHYNLRIYGMLARKAVEAFNEENAAFCDLALIDHIYKAADRTRSNISAAPAASPNIFKHLI
ncbi:MAG TPA: hypothetical protein VGC14_10730 [Rhizobium sp.]